MRDTILNVANLAIAFMAIAPAVEAALRPGPNTVCSAPPPPGPPRHKSWVEYWAAPEFRAAIERNLAERKRFAGETGPK